MGLEYHIVQRDKKELLQAICDKCGLVIVTAGEGSWNEWGPKHSHYHEPYLVQEVFSFTKSWGYHSKKDETTHKVVLCEPCYDEVFKGVSIKTSRPGVSLDFEDLQ